MDRVGDEVAKELARSGSRDALPLASVTTAWPEVVGDAVSRHAWPLRISRDGTLHVATASATWAHELDLLGPDILERLSARLGDETPSKLRFAVGPIPEPAEAVAGPPAEASVEPGDVPPETASEAAAAASVIADPELRELVARAARTSLHRARSGRRFW